MFLHVLTKAVVLDSYVMLLHDEISVEQDANANLTSSTMLRPQLPHVPLG